MDSNYRVVGIVELSISGQWSQQSVRGEIYAVDHEHARDSILALYRVAFPAAQIVRWHTRHLVQVARI
jgi:hypothetical protein